MDAATSSRTPTSTADLLTVDEHLFTERLSGDTHKQAVLRWHQPDREREEDQDEGENVVVVS